LQFAAQACCIPTTPVVSGMKMAVIPAGEWARVLAGRSSFKNKHLDSTGYPFSPAWLLFDNQH
jgi:hypothetical protein